MTIDATQTQGLNRELTRDALSAGPRGKVELESKDDRKTQGADGEKSFSLFGDDGLSFWDVLDVFNPLQHIPLLNSVYREVTGDQITPAANGRRHPVRRPVRPRRGDDRRRGAGNDRQGRGRTRGRAGHRRDGIVRRGFAPRRNLRPPQPLAGLCRNHGGGAAGAARAAASAGPELKPPNLPPSRKPPPPWRRPNRR
jgi:hypothetical protein